MRTREQLLQDCLDWLWESIDPNEDIGPSDDPEMAKEIGESRLRVYPDHAR